MKRSQGRHWHIGANSEDSSNQINRRLSESKLKPRQNAPGKKRCAWIFVLLLSLAAISFVLVMVFVEVLNPEGGSDLTQFFSRRRSLEPEKPVLELYYACVVKVKKAW